MRCIMYVNAAQKLRKYSTGYILNTHTTFIHSWATSLGTPVHIFMQVSNQPSHI